MKDETNQFEQEVNLLDQPLNPEGPVEEKVEEEESPQNRRERRLQEKYQAEKEANIAMAARLEAVSEAQKFQQDAKPSEYLQSVERIYGTDSPEANAATELLKQALTGAKEEAKREAIEAFREEQRQQAEKVRKESEELDSMIENIEDSHNITFSPEMQKGFFTLLEKMSPKDKDGNVKEYADPEAVYEIFSEKLQKRTDSRAKDLSSRSMTQGSSSESTLTDDSTRRYLKEIGIIN